VFDQSELITVIGKSLNMSNADLTLESSLTKELGVDSIEMLRLTRDLCKSFDCELEPEEVRAADRLDRILELLYAKAGDRSPGASPPNDLAH
jgi:acyl carrier protein